MIRTFFHAASTTMQRVRGGRAEGRGGDDNDLVSRGQHDHIQSPAPQRVRGGREGEGRGKGGDNDLVSRGQHDHAVIRPATGEKGEGGGILFHAASTTTSSHPRRNG